MSDDLKERMSEWWEYDHGRVIGQAKAYIEELETKLAKAVEALEGLVELHDLSTNEINPKTVLECAYTTLAELKGETDE